MTDVRPSSLMEAMKERGGLPTAYHGRELVRHFGDPAVEYAAATDGVAVFDRSHRTRLRVRGRAPGQMLDGILTGTIPVAPTEAEPGVLAGRATYHCALTPKGKVISDLWAWSLGDEDENGYLLDVPVAGRAGLLEHFRTFLPPRMAKVEDVSGETAMITLVGPEAATHLSRAALGLRVEAHDLDALGEGEYRGAGSEASASLLVTRTEDVWPPAWSVVGPDGAVVALWKAVVDAGGRPAGLGAWQTLRVEAGRPAYGIDVDDGTIPVEAGIHDRAIDYQKGCYTGQEVIVRIRDRGHVNRSLRRVHLGEVPTPPTGAELVAPSSETPEKVVGRVTTAVQSPRFGETVALAYVRRGTEPDDLVVKPGS